MRSLNPQERASVKALIRSLAVVDLDAPSPTEATFPARLAELTGGTAATTRHVARARGWGFEYLHTSGDTAVRSGLIAALGDLTAQMDRAEELTLFDPLRPEPAQQNRVVEDATLRANAIRAGTLVWRAYERHGLDRLSQIRALICDGPMLLTWVGAYRDEPFGARERRILECLVAPLRRRLRVERVLRGAQSNGFAGALDEIAFPSFVATAHGSIEHANRVGTDVLSRSRRDVVGLIDRALKGGPSNDVSLIEISEKATPARFLVIVRGSHSDHSARIGSCCRDWRLTRRQGEVLEHLVRGDANKDIATKLACAPRTVEIHVSAILNKAGVEDRRRLALRFWGCAR